jgi:chromate transporter
MKYRWKDQAQLFVSFLKIGAFMFGGGYSMLPLLMRELVDKRGWTSEEELLDYFAISQCTPGVIAVNTATFIGNKRGGALGGAVATLAVILVPMTIVVFVASVLMRFWHLPMVQSAFNGIRAAVAALIAAAVVKLLRSNVRNLFGIVLCVVAFAVVAVFGQSPIIVVAGATLAGLIAGRMRK